MAAQGANVLLRFDDVSATLVQRAYNILSIDLIDFWQAIGLNVLVNIIFRKTTNIIDYAVFTPKRKSPNTSRL
jgi:hypothetical protein